MKKQTETSKPFLEKLGSGIDRVIGIFNPKAAYHRSAFRTAGGIQAASYKGASKTRLRSDWAPLGYSADMDILPDLVELRQRSRDLNRNDAHAAGITSTMVTNTVGTGIKLQSRIDAETLGITEEKANELRIQAEKAFEKWCNFADAGERLNFDEIQALVDKQILENGEAVLQAVMIPDDSSRPFSFALDNIESDRLDTPLDKKTDKSIRGGVEIGSRGQPVAYWIKKTHPGDLKFSKTFSTTDYVRVTAKNDAGRRNILHLFPLLRAGQTRGVPFFAPVLTYFKDLSDYMEAELVAARIAACFAIFIKKNDAFDAAQAYTSQTNAAGQREHELEPGLIETLNPGEDIATFNPNRPGGTFEPFVDRILRALATGLNLPYEIVAKDFSKTNYSSARAALLQAYRYFKVRQKFLASHLCQPAYEFVLEEAYLRGEFDVPDFYENKYDYCRAMWVPQGWQWVDPLKEAESSKLAIDRGLSTLSDETASQGKDWEEVLEQRARELKKIKELEKRDGITIIESDSKTTNPNPAGKREIPAQPSEEVIPV